MRWSTLAVKIWPPALKGLSALVLAISHVFNNRVYYHLVNLSLLWDIWSFEWSIPHRIKTTTWILDFTIADRHGDNLVNIFYRGKVIPSLKIFMRRLHPNYPEQFKRSFSDGSRLAKWLRREYIDLTRKQKAVTQQTQNICITFV